MIKNNYKKVIAVFFSILGYVSVLAQGTLIDFSTIPKSGTILIYTHSDDDLIWMLPFWSISEKFIGGAMPRTPTFETIISQQQSFLNNNGYNINYASNWITPWGSITQQEYAEYYWNSNSAYYYLANEYLKTSWSDSDIQVNRGEINRIKSKLEQYIADPNISRIITHDNWGEDNHLHHITLNTAVRELAVKYRKDVWMLGCTISTGVFTDITIPNGITYTLASFNKPALYTGIRDIYQNNGCWTWRSEEIPSGDHKFIKIIDGGVDKSNILTGESVSISGPYQLEPGAFIFDGNQDYLTLEGNKYPSFTVAMRVRPDQIRSMDISKMTEYPASANSDRNFYLNNDGRVSARINDGTPKVVTSTSAITAGTWSHIVMTSNGSSLKIYVNGRLENTISAGTSTANYVTPEFVLGQTGVTASFFRGQINDVRLFNYALTDTEVAALSGFVFTITSSADAGGNINPNGEETVIVGASKAYSITPNNNYAISDVKVDNISVGAVSSYLFSNITANHTISASFVPLVTYTIISSAGAGGSIDPSGTLHFNEGTNRTFTITPDVGYRISDVTIDETSSGAISAYTFNNITGNHTISAKFDVTPTYTITSSTNAGGTINPSGIISVNEGSNQTYHISANNGYKISGVSVDNNPAGAISTYTFNNITVNHSISVSFAPIPAYSITSGSGAGGSIDPDGTVTVYEGNDQIFTFSPNIGYQTSDVKVDNTSLGVLSTYTFNNITASHTIYTSFTPITFTITGSAGTGGSISPSGIQTLNYGTSQTYNISCDQGYRISDVKVDNISVGAVSTYTFNNVKASHSISVTFSIINYTISSSAGTGGTISPSGAVTVDYGTNRTFTIIANSGYIISDVRADNVSMGAVSSYVFNNVTANHTISAAFTPITFTITSSAGVNGSISPGGIVTVNYGTSRVFSITPDHGYQVMDVEVDNNSIGAVTSYTFDNVLTNHTITATFEVAKYTIDGSAGENGFITPAGIITLDHGTIQTYTIGADIGYMISDVRVDNISIGAVLQYTFNNISDNHTISATFSIITNTITGSSGNNGLITPGGNVSVNYGSNQFFTITANTGHNISDVRIDNVSVGAVSIYTFNNVTAGHTISATFSPITYIITTSSGNDGSITPSGIITASYGTNQTYSITPNPGYHISDVRVDNNSIGAVSSYTFSNITASHNISATFAINTYIITGDSGTGGSISPIGLTTLNFWTNQVYRITPDPGYRISDVIMDNISVGPVSTYTFNNIAANHTISATFSIITYTIAGSAGTGGSISPAGVVTVNHGTNRSYNIIAESGFQISDLKVDNISVNPVSTYTFNNVTANHTISATFSLISYTITGNIEKGEGEKEGGSISPAGRVRVNYGTNQTYTILPYTGYEILDVTVDNISLGALTSYIFRDVTTDHTISAKFRPIIYTIKGIAGSGGSLHTEGNETVIYGTNQTYSITPDAGYQISEVLVDGISAGTPLSYTFKNITANHTISVTFTRIIYLISASAGTGGSISPSVILSMYYGENQTYTITPDSTFKILDVIVDNISLGPVSTYTFNDVTANHTISATFNLKNIFLITATAGTGGTISPSGTISLFEGMNQTCIITPFNGYRISNIKIDNIPSGILSDYTFNNLMSDHSISATFTMDIDVKVYPNPFKNYLKINIVSPNEDFFDISIIDITEKIVFTKTNIPANTETRINLQYTPPGIYILRLYSKGKRMTTHRIVKY